jgi:signal transduction histidine kinase
MDVPRDTMEPAPPRRRRFDRSSDNRLVQAVGRVRLPLGAKLVVGFTVVAALLGLVAALGLRALNQSNSRGEQLRSLQQIAAFALLMRGDAAELSALVSQRSGSGFSGGGLGGVRPDVLVAIDTDVFTSYAQFNADLQLPAFAGGLGGHVRSFDPQFVPKLKATLAAFQAVWGTVNSIDQNGTNPPPPALNQNLAKAGKLVSRAITEADSLGSKATERADALVAANHNGFVNSRNLLIGVGAGSLTLALAFGLLLSWSVVAPLRRTQQRLATIARGDFAGHVEVTNRDEIGALAADVNRMNDELGRLYRELETASRHKSDFLATMSHELRTPLNAIIGFSEVLHEQMFGELNERQLAYVNDVLEAGKHLLSLINDVLDLAKIEAGRMELTLSDVAIPELLRSAVSMHSDRADRGGIVLALTTDPAEITIPADERRVRQVVVNLLSNAVKFTPPDGRVDVSARLDNGHVEIAVADTGPGIPAEDLESIFEEFEQAGDGKQAEEGTGLGLPLSRKLVELHGGRLWAESEPGHGSTFHFTLPAHQKSAV